MKELNYRSVHAIYFRTSEVITKKIAKHQVLYIYIFIAEIYI